MAANDSRNPITPAKPAVVVKREGSPAASGLGRTATPKAPETPPKRDPACTNLGRHRSNCDCTGTMRAPI